jgi:serine protease Do
VTLDVVRYGDRRKVKVQLTEAETGGNPTRTAEGPRQAPAEENGSKLGVAVQPLTAELARELGYDQPGGIVITDVQPYGPANRAGIPRGTRVLAVDGDQVGDVASFRQALERKRAGQVVSLQLQFRNGSRSILNVRLPG